MSDYGNTELNPVTPDNAPRGRLAGVRARVLRLPVIAAALAVLLVAGGLGIALASGHTSGEKKTAAPSVTQSKTSERSTSPAATTTAPAPVQTTSAAPAETTSEAAPAPVETPPADTNNGGGSGNQGGSNGGGSGNQGGNSAPQPTQQQPQAPAPAPVETTQQAPAPVQTTQAPPPAPAPSVYQFVGGRDIASMVNPQRVAQGWPPLTNVATPNCVNSAGTNVCGGHSGACGINPNGIGTAGSTVVRDGQFEDQYGNCIEVMSL